MLRRYNHNQVIEKLEIDDAELGFLVHHFREFLSVSEHDQQFQNYSEQDIMLLARAYRLMRDEGQDPAAIRAAMQEEISGNGMSGQRQVVAVAFCSGRAGTGKSALIYNIAAALAAKGSRCVIFDGSCGSDRHTYSGALAQDSSWCQTLDSGVRVFSGEKFLCAIETDSGVRPNEWDKQLGDIDRASDFILVDVGAGRPDNALRYAMVVDETVIVTTPDVGSNTDCFSVIRMMTDVDAGLHLSIILNRAATLGEARESFARISGAAGKLEIREPASMGWVAEDEALRACMAEGEAVVTALPTSISARCIGRIADHLIHRLTPVMPSKGGGMAALVQALGNAVQREASVSERS